MRMRGAHIPYSLETGFWLVRSVPDCHPGAVFGSGKKPQQTTSHSVRQESTFYVTLGAS